MMVMTTMTTTTTIMSNDFHVKWWCASS